MSQFRRLAHEIHRRSVWQVLAIYLVACWIVYQVVLAVYEGVGLPDWVPVTALVLLLVGLPIVLATAIVQEGGPGQSGPRGSDEGEADAPVRPDPVTAAPPSAAGSARRRHGLFTWRRAITGGVLAFAALGLAATGFMGMRALGVGPAATLMSSGVLAEREPILLAEFGSPSGDSVLAAAVTEALRVDLESSAVVELVQVSAIQQSLRRMRRDPGTRVDASLAREIAARDGVRAVLVGEVTLAGGGYIVSARMLEPDGGVLMSARETAVGDGVIEATDRLSRKIREQIGESLRTIRRAEPLAQVTTGSLDALRKYTQGVRAFNSEADNTKAIGLLGEAVALDSAFAMAWRKLGVAYQFVDGDSTRAALTKAFEHRDRLTDRERYLTEGSYYDLVARDTARSMLAYQTLLDLAPDDRVALNNLARLYGLKEDWVRAVEVLGRSVELDSTAAVGWRNYIEALPRVRRFEEAARALDAYETFHPGHYQVPLFRGALSAARFDYQAAEQELEKVAAYEGREHTAAWVRASVAYVQGRHDEGRRIQSSDPDLPEIAGRIAAAAVAVMHSLDPEVASAHLGTITVDDILAAPAGQRPWPYLISLNVTAGRVDSAEALLRSWEAAEPGDFDPPATEVIRSRAEIAFGRGDPQPLIDAYSQGLRSEPGCMHCIFNLARGLDGAGMADSAVATYERYLEPDHPPLFRVNRDRVMLPYALQRLGALHEEAGRPERAAEYHSRLLDLWKDADPVLQPRLEAARRALARLTSER